MNIGILGAGQLGRMLALAGYSLGHNFGFYDINNNCDPVNNLGRVFSPHKDNNALDEFIKFADVVSFESENTELDLVRKIAKKVSVYPSEKSLKITQNRTYEKALFDKLNIACAPYQVVNSLTDINRAIADIGLPAVLKTTTQGYDGKGQFVINNASQVELAWQSVGKVESIVEGFIDFKCEVSLVAVRDANNNCKYYPLVENVHKDGILRLTTVPAQNIDSELQKIAENYMQLLFHEMNYVGILTLEMFVTSKGLIANEIAPRVHNSGHWSMDGAKTSQFENHIRAITTSPLGATDLIYSMAAMINIISDTNGSNIALQLDNTHLHLYNKTQRSNRKLGHININADTKEQLDLNMDKLNFLLK